VKAGSASPHQPACAAVSVGVLPSTSFHRSVGVWDGVATDPEGRPIAHEKWPMRQRHWLPSSEDRELVSSPMKRVSEPGKVVGWIEEPGEMIFPYLMTVGGLKLAAQSLQKMSENFSRCPG
jgi:hypothetical protein